MLYVCNTTLCETTAGDWFRELVLVVSDALSMSGSTQMGGAPVIWPSVSTCPPGCQGASNREGIYTIPVEI
jgi:hypothetical protein